MKQAVNLDPHGLFILGKTVKEQVNGLKSLKISSMCIENVVTQKRKFILSVDILTNGKKETKNLKFDSKIGN